MRHLDNLWKKLIYQQSTLIKKKKKTFVLCLYYNYRTSYSEFSSKNSKDERYKSIEKSREREGLFNEYMVELRKQEKEEKAMRREQVSEQFYFIYINYKSFIYCLKYCYLCLYNFNSNENMNCNSSFK